MPRQSPEKGCQTATSRGGIGDAKIQNRLHNDFDASYPMQHSGVVVRACLIADLSFSGNPLFSLEGGREGIFSWEAGREGGRVAYRGTSFMRNISSP